MNQNRQSTQSAPSVPSRPNQYIAKGSSNGQRIGPKAGVSGTSTNGLRQKGQASMAKASKNARDQAYLKKRQQLEYEPVPLIDTDDEEELTNGTRSAAQAAAAESEKQAAAVKLKEQLGQLTAGDWVAAKENLMALLQETNDRIGKMEAHSSTLEAKSGAATELAADGLLKAKEAYRIAASAMRQSSKVCIVLSGNAMPRRNPERVKQPIRIALYLMKKFLHLDVHKDELLSCHYRPEPSSDIIMKFGNVSDNSAYDNILKESRQKRPRGFFAKILEAECDSAVYYLLRLMRRAGEAQAVYTAKSGKPGGKVLIDGNFQFRVFEDEESVRAVMGPKSKDQEATEDTEKLPICRQHAQNDVKLKQQVKGVYYDTEKTKMRMKLDGEKQGQGKKLIPVDRVDLELERKTKLRRVGKSARGRGRGFNRIDQRKNSPRTDDDGLPRSPKDKVTKPKSSALKGSEEPSPEAAAATASMVPPVTWADEDIISDGIESDHTDP